MVPASRASYGRESRPRGSEVVAVLPQGPAARAGVAVGDVLLLANDTFVRDIIDWQWIADGPAVSAELRDREGYTREIALTRNPGESWGLEFAEAVFDGVRVCHNDCIFCFMSQLPANMRPSLYLRDDDYRLSFLQGNFITLTNLDDHDVQRIIEQRLSPLHVSLHAVDPSVRERLVCTRGDDMAPTALDTLLDAGIIVHVQIVLVPGVNDLGVLDETLAWLCGRDGVMSVGIVPVGYTDHQHTLTESYSDPETAGAFLDWLDARRVELDRTRGTGWLQVADEFFLSSRRDVPVAEYYADFPQYENGIGLVRAFIDDFEAALLTRAPRRDVASDPVTLLSGDLFAPVLGALIAAHGLAAVTVLPVANRFFGGNVSVTGLLTAADIIAALEQEPSARRLLLPGCVFNSDGLTLDDMTFDLLDKATDQQLTLVSCDPTALVNALFGLPEEA